MADADRAAHSAVVCITDDAVRLRAGTAAGTAAFVIPPPRRHRAPSPEPGTIAVRRPGHDLWRAESADA